MNDHKRPLTRLIIRFPSPLYAALKAEADEKAIPMAILVRQLVSTWAASKAPASTAATR